MKGVRIFIRNFGALNLLFIVLTLMDPMNKGYLFGYLVVALLFLKREALRNDLDSYFLMMLVFSTTYACFYYLNPWKGMQYFVIYFISPPFFYLWGKQIVKATTSQSQIFILLVILGCIYSLPALISVVLNIMEGGFAQSNRNIAMFWGGGEINATGMAAFLMFNMCIPGLLISGSKNMPRWLTLALLIIFFLSIASVLRLGSRTQLGILLISLVLALVYVTPQFTFRQNLTIYSIIIGVIFLVLQNISFDLGSDLFTSFAGRMEEGGAEDLAGGGGRVELWKMSIEFMLIYPFGWDLSAFGYSHNLWLDTLRVGGILPAILLLIYFLKVYGLLLKILKSKTLTIAVRLAFLVFNIAFLSVFMVEPGIDGAFSMFIFFCFFTGIMFQAYKTHGNLEENEVVEKGSHLGG